MRAEVLPRAIDAVLRQQWPAEWGPYEIVLVDDASTDTTAEVVARYDERLRYIQREVNGGLCAARNAGIDAARGDYIIFLDDDDEPLPGWLLGLTRLVLADAATVGSCGVEVRDERGAIVKVSRPSDLGPAFDYARGLLLPGAFITASEALRAIGGFRRGLPAVHQTELMLRLLPWCRENHQAVVTTDDVLLRMHRADPGDRPLHSPEGILAGALVLLEHHRDRIGRSRRLLASYLAVAGVSAARLERWSQSRSLLVQAVRARPLGLRNWARMALALFPALGRRVWKVDHYIRPQRRERFADLGR
jgi:glycosyltransferase involved in cell wall biosynthesis